ncbi:MAG: ATP-binding protein [Opitutae bacterium]
MALDLRAHPFISHFAAAQGLKLVKQVRLVRYPHQAMIFDEGSPSDSIYLVFTGRIILTKKSAGGSPQIIAYKGPDDYFGELGVLDGSNRSTAAIADGPVHLGRIPQKAFLKGLAESSWHTVLRLFSHVSENLRSTNDRYVTEVVRKEKITLIGEMANSMIHDFRSPFTTIRLVTESLALHHPDAKTQAYAATILRQVDRLSGTMEEVLEFSRGETRLRVKAVPLREIFQHLQENNAAFLAQAGVRLQCKSSPVVLALDADRFQRVLQNLVTNAVEALRGKKSRRITITARAHHDQVLITIADNGPGIPTGIRSTIFEPFVSHGKAGGTGLGLALVRSIVEAHHGKITYRTARTGTTFTVQLPVMP